jgi:hypothetical protein
MEHVFVSLPVLAVETISQWKKKGRIAGASTVEIRGRIGVREGGGRMGGRMGVGMGSGRGMRASLGGSRG